MGSKGSSGEQTCYYGTLAALICAGPVDELVGLAVDGKLVWPDAPQWADGLVEARTIGRRRQSNTATVVMEKEHNLKDGDLVTITGFADASFNAAAASVTVRSAFSFSYANTGPNTNRIDDRAGRVTKNKVYAAGDLVRDGATIWECKTGHTANLANRPPSSFWQPYSVKRLGSQNPFVFTVPDWGAVDFYWGTADQVLATSGCEARAAFCAAGHPPYRRQCWALLRDFKFGVERQAAPNVEFIVRRVPDQSLITGDAAALADGQANPLAAFAELLTSPLFGLGVSRPPLAAATWQAVADDLAAAADQTGLSITLDRAETARAIAARLICYYDGFFRFNANGEIEAGRFLHNEAPPEFTDATTIDYHDLVEEIAWDSSGWQDTVSRISVRYSDRASAFKTRLAEYVSSFNRAVTGEDRRQTLDRPWIVRAGQAAAHAAELGKIAAEPHFSGSLVVRAEKAAAIAPGELFRLTHDAMGLSLCCRCTEKTLAKPPAGRVKIRFLAERGCSLLPFHPTPTGEPIEPPPPRFERLDLYAFVRPPAELAGRADTLLLLAARTSSLTIGLRLWMREADSSLFTLVGEQRGWAVTGVLSADYIAPAEKTTTYRSRAANFAVLTVPGHGLATGQHVAITGLGGTGYDTADAVVTVLDDDTLSYASEGDDESQTADAGGIVTPLPDDDSETLQVNPDPATLDGDLSNMSETQTADDVAAARILVWVFSAADPTQFEIMALRACRLDDAGLLRLKVRRGRFGTSIRSFEAGDRLWLCRRAAAIWHYLDIFPTYYAQGVTGAFQLQAFTESAAADLADPAICPEIQWQFGPVAASNLKPGLSWITPASNPASLPTDGVLSPEASIQKNAFQIVRVELFSLNHQTGIQTFWLNVAPPNLSSIYLSDLLEMAGISPPSIDFGTQGQSDQYFTLTLRVTDSIGQVVDSSVTLILPKASGSLGTVSFNPPGEEFFRSLNVTLQVGGSATYIHYKIVPLGSPAPTDPIVFAGTSKTVLLTLSRRIWARASDGTNHGAWQFEDYILSKEQ